MDEPRTAYSQPEKLCDLILKGGITSGVVYPLGICLLAEKYSFKNVGGASAGAIAAAAAAAAEYGRRNGRPQAFDDLKNLPDWLSKETHLRQLFQPDRTTRPLFDLIFPFLETDTKPLKKICQALASIVRNYPTWCVLPPVLWCALAAYTFRGSSAPSLTCGIIMAFLLGVTTAAAGILAFPLRELLTRHLPENFYGLSRAFDPESSNTDAPLTNWLTSYLNHLAGKDLEKNGPLTFGDLGHTHASPAEEDVHPPSRLPGVNLEVMTTCLNLGRPYRLPFREEDGVFYFCKEEFARLFPEAVVKQMVNDAGSPSHTLPGKTLYLFPKADRLPVVVAARMSLSFPVLISAVPLYKEDLTRETRTRLPERCWFSDGGICSNLPIHFFDSPVPRWPTFGINLKQTPPGHEQDENRVWMPANPDDAWHDIWTRFEESPGAGSMAGFLKVLIETMQSWRDTLHGQMPGYRERIVHINLNKDEGGLNLGMTTCQTLKLSTYGTQAGEEILSRFKDHYDSGPPWGWADHRWIRFRSSLDVTEEWLMGMLSRLQNPLPPDLSLESIIPKHVDLGSSSILAEDEQEFIDCLKKLLGVAKTFMVAADRIAAEPREEKRPGGVFAQNSPIPNPELRIRPKF